MSTADPDQAVTSRSAPIDTPGPGSGEAGGVLLVLFPLSSANIRLTHLYPLPLSITRTIPPQLIFIREAEVVNTIILYRFSHDCPDPEGGVTAHPHSNYSDAVQASILIASHNSKPFSEQLKNEISETKPVSEEEAQETETLVLTDNEGKEQGEMEAKVTDQIPFDLEEYLKRIGCDNLIEELRQARLELDREIQGDIAVGG